VLPSEQGLFITGFESLVRKAVAVVSQAASRRLDLLRHVLKLGQHEAELGLDAGKDGQRHLIASHVVGVVGLVHLGGAGGNLGLAAGWVAAIKERTLGTDT
jgi:hypothetical protein